MRVLLIALLAAISYAQTEPLNVDTELVDLLNDLRAAGGTCGDGNGGTNTYAANSVPLEFDCRLWKASQLHSQDMADNDYFSHDSQDGRSPWDRAEAQGISANAENIAAGNPSAQATLDQWKRSDGHCNNMMNPSAKLVGVARGENSDRSLRYYWTQMFAAEGQKPAVGSCLSSGADALPLAVGMLVSVFILMF